MSDSKRATLITVGAPKSEKKNVTKTVRLTINLDESNESKYPELNYKELVRAAEKKSKIQNGKNTGLDPFSDNDDDVERVAKKFEQKYGSKSTYGSKGRSKRDEYADIGAGYDENDSFIDNTDGYDEMMPPGCDTRYGGFYINCGLLEFETVTDNHVSTSDGEMQGTRRNKRRLSSSSSEDDSSESCSEPESPDEKDPKSTLVNGNAESHKTEHRKKKSKKCEKSKAKRMRRADSSTANSGKQTSDENNQGDAESDSRTSHSDSLTSKPATSENPATSDSSRDAATELKLPSNVNSVLDEISSCISRFKISAHSITAKEFESTTDPLIIRLEQAITNGSMTAQLRRACWTKGAQIMFTTYGTLTKRARGLISLQQSSQPPVTSTTSVPHQIPLVTERVNHRPPSPPLDTSNLTQAEKDKKITETLERLKALIDEKKPSIIATYKAECERVQEEKKKMKILAASGTDVPPVEKRLPKRRFPWCQRSRGLLATLTRLAGSETNAAILLAQRALPLFPAGFVRIPTLLRQANLNRDLSTQIKTSDLKKQTINSVTAPIQPAPTQASIQAALSSAFNEPIHFPSSLTVTATVKTHETPCDTNEDEIKKNKHKNKNHHKDKEPYLPSIFGAFDFSNNINVDKSSNDKIRNSDLIVDKSDKTAIDSKYVNNNAGFTITPVLKPESKSSKANVTNEPKKDSQPIRVKSQATLIKEADELAKKDKSNPKPEKQAKPEKRASSPLHIDTTFPKTKTPDVQKSPNLAKNNKTSTVEHIPQKQIETMRVAENNIPRPGLVPVHVSPTFAKPDKRAPDPKKPKKDWLIVSDLDPLGEGGNNVNIEAVDDSSSDVEVIGEILPEDKTDSNKIVNNEVKKPSESSNQDKLLNNLLKTASNSNSTDKVSVNNRDGKKPNHVERMDVDDTEADIHKVMQNLREMQDSQGPTLSSSFNSVITSAAKHLKAPPNSVDIFDAKLTRADKNKLSNFFQQNGWMRH